MRKGECQSPIESEISSAYFLIFFFKRKLTMFNVPDLLNGKPLMLGIAFSRDCNQMITAKSLEEDVSGRYKIGDTRNGMIRQFALPCIIWRYGRTAGDLPRINNPDPNAMKREIEYYVGKNILTRDEAEQVFIKSKDAAGSLLSFANAYFNQEPKADEKGVKKILPYEHLFTEEEEDILHKIVDIAPHHSLVVKMLEQFSNTIQSMNFGGADCIHMAAFIHNAFIYVHPLIDGNGRNARLLANFILVAHGMQPIIRTKEYNNAVMLDMKQTRHKDDVSNLKIQTNMMRGFIYSWQKSKMCTACGRSMSDQQCSKCGITKYCSRECQKKDWPNHKQLCTKNAGRFKELIAVRNAALEHYRQVVPIQLDSLVKESAKDTAENYSTKMRKPSTCETSNWIICGHPETRISDSHKSEMLKICANIMAQNTLSPAEKMDCITVTASRYKYTVGKWILSAKSDEIDDIYKKVIELPLSFKPVVSVKVNDLVLHLLIRYMKRYRPRSNL